MTVQANRRRARFSWLAPAMILLLIAAAVFIAGCDSDEEPEAVTASAAGCDLEEGEPGTGSGPKDALEVVLATPEGERQELYSIDVTFSEPMVALGERGKRSGSGPIRFEPKLSGSFTWLGTRTVSFLLSSPPAPGTRIVCTLPRGTRAMSGRQLTEDHTWTILFRPARLLASIPAQPPRRDGQDASPRLGRHLPDEPILLAFDRPVSDRELSGIILESVGDVIPLGRVPVLHEHMQALRRQNRRVDSLNVLALLPDRSLSRGSVCRLTLTPALRFRDSPVGLVDSMEIRFRIPGHPKIHEIKTFDGGFDLVMESPVDPDTLLAYLQLEPHPGRLTALAWSRSGQDAVSVRGNLAHGSEIAVTVPAGLPDVTGRTTQHSFHGRATMPHARSVFSIEPDDGVIIPGPEEYLRLSGRNTSPVRMRWVWVTSDEMPLFEAENVWGGAVGASRDRFRAGMEWGGMATERTPWEARWHHGEDWPDPQEQRNSIRRWEKRLVDFEPRPPDAQLLLFEAAAFRSDWHTSSHQPNTFVQSTALQTSTLGISARQGPDRGLIWVTDLVTGLPVEGARVSIWTLPRADDDLLPEARWDGITDSDGICWTPGISQFDGSHQRRMARAESEGRVVWLRLGGYYGGYHGATQDDAKLPNSAFLITDRPIYRPGETVHWKGVVRHSDRTGLTPVDVSGMEVVLSGGREDDIRLPVRQTMLGNPYGEIEIPETIGTGRYSLQLAIPPHVPDESDPGAAARERFLDGTWILIESFRAPRFSAEISTTTPLVVSGEDARITGKFAYFSGPPLAGQPVVWRTARSHARWSPPGWDRFLFREELPGFGWTPREHAGSAPTGSGEARLDSDGRLDLELPLVLPPEADDSRVTVEIGARDLTDQSAYARTEISLVRGPYRPGVHSLIPDAASVDEGTWEWIIVDTGGEPAKGLQVALELYRRDWKTARVRRVGGSFDYETSVQDTLLSTVRAVSGAEPQSQGFPIPEPGYYFVRVAVQQPDGSTLTAATGRRFRGALPFQAFRRGVTHLSLELDRTSAEPGDTVHAVFPAPEGGAQGLVLLESGGIVSASRMSLQGTPSVPVPLLNIAPPDASITVLLAGPDRVPMSQVRGPRRFPPFFAEGSATVEITPGRWRATVEVRPDREVAGPGEEIEIEVRVTSPEGDPLSGEVAIAVVDEAVLALVDDQHSDPLRRLFQTRGSGTCTDDTRHRMQFSPLRGKGEGSPGGGGEEDGPSIRSPRADFRPTAYWNPALPVGADGVARVRVSLPDALTGYRIRATAVTEGDRHGVGEARFRTMQPLICEPAIPRFVRLGDEWTLGAVVENHTDRTMRVEVRCELDGAEIRGRDRWSGDIKPGTTARADFRVRSTREGAMEYLLEATAADGSAGDSRKGSLLCLDPVETIREIAFGRAYPVGEETLLLDDDLLGSAGELEVRIAASLLSGLSEPIDYLINYPHPCLEQRASRLLALLARRDLADRMPAGGPDPARLDSLMKAGIASLSSHMTWTGFSLWPGSHGGSPYLDGFLLYTLSRLRSGGVEVPDELHKKAWKTVHTRLQAPGGGGRGVDPDTRAFLTYAMVAARPGMDAPPAELAGQAIQDVEIERLDAGRSGMSAAGRLCLILAMGEMRRQDPLSRGVSARRAEFIFDEVAQGMDRTARLASIRATGAAWPWSSSRDDRVRATALAALFLSDNLPDHPLLPSMINWLLQERGRGRWRNTHENAWALEAVRTYAERAEDLILPMQGRLTPGISASRGFRFTRDDLAPVEMRFTLEELSAFRRPDPQSTALPLRIESVGQNALYYEMRLEQRLRALEGPPREEGLIVFREYVEAASGKPTERLDRGEPLLVHLAVVVPWDTESLVLEDHLPAGVEALNLNLLTTSHLQPRSPTGGAGRSGPGAQGSRGGHGSDRMPRGGSVEAPDLLPVSYRDLRDDRVILYADNVPAGVYHIYYPVVATTPGVYTVPGARAEFMYSPEIFGSSGAARVEVR